MLHLQSSAIGDHHLDDGSFFEHMKQAAEEYFVELGELRPPFKARSLTASTFSPRAARSGYRSNGVPTSGSTPLAGPKALPRAIAYSQVAITLYTADDIEDLRMKQEKG
jgi:hypothetical protein